MYTGLVGGNLDSRLNRAWKRPEKCWTDALLHTRCDLLKASVLWRKRREAKQENMKWNNNHEMVRSLLREVEFLCTSKVDF